MSTTVSLVSELERLASAIASDDAEFNQLSLASVASFPASEPSEPLVTVAHDPALQGAEDDSPPPGHPSQGDSLFLEGTHDLESLQCLLSLGLGEPGQRRRRHGYPDSESRISRAGQISWRSSLEEVG